MDLTNAFENKDDFGCANKAHQFGRDVNLAMACMNGAQRLQNNKPVEHQSTPTLSVSELRTKLHTVSAQLDTNRAELIRLLVQFDWKFTTLSIGQKVVTPR